MTIEQAVSLVRDLGFPIAVTAYVLVRMEKTIRGLTDALVDLRLVVARDFKPWDGRERRRFSLGRTERPPRAADGC